jgi:peptidyl-prolyl cis-trans isomerase B (cyclophilin B)
MTVGIKYIIVVGIIAMVLFLLYKTGVSFLSSTDEQQEISSIDNEISNVVEGAQIVDIQTNFGIITIELFSADAPKTVENFIVLADSGFYNGTKFHRVIKDFMIQGGDPNSKDDDWSDDGRGGPGYAFEDEINRHKIVRGVLAMANSGPNTNGSQFFIVTATEAPWLDGLHTVFGRVVDMDVVDRIKVVATNEQDHPLDDVIVEGITIQR